MADAEALRLSYYLPAVFDTAEKRRLAGIFPDGVCDYAKPGVGQSVVKGTWLTHRPAGSGLGSVSAAGRICETGSTLDRDAAAPFVFVDVKL